MTLDELVELTGVLAQVAHKAGALVLEGYRKGGAVHKKGEIDLVTDFDLASEDLIVRELSQACPGLAIVGEEGRGDGAEPAPEGYACYVDPIDGTTNFAHGHPFFAVSLGVCRDGAPLAGVVFAPALNALWSGVVGRGCLRNGEPCQVSTRARLLKDALCATGFGYDVVGSADDNVREFAAVQARCRGIRRCGSAALDLALTADGTYDAYWEYLLRPWDLAGGAALVLAAGGKVSDLDGTSIDVRHGALLASNGLVHEELRALLSETRGGRPFPAR